MKPGGGQVEIESVAEKGPHHVAIIMDGNGRWAAKRGLPRAAGHRAGVEAVRRVVRAAGEMGISYLTLYAFSTENWKRPQAEIDALMDLLVRYLRSELDELKRNGARVRFIGDLSALPPAAVTEARRVVRATEDNDRLVVTVALNYGARKEIVEVARELCRQAAAGRLNPDDLDEETFARRLYTAPLPDPDLIIRSAGELRLSNFLLWQAAYAELWTTAVLWPDFDRSQLEAAVREFQRRERRYGGLPGSTRVGG